ncbi:MAG: AI-2E family transporter [Haloferacaceae archaeon]
MGSVLAYERSRAAWWAVAAVAAAALALFLYSFVGTFVLGLFFYYAARPLYREVLRLVESRRIAATLTMLLLVLPVIALLGYAVVMAFREFSSVVDPAVQNTVLRRIFGRADPMDELLNQPLIFLTRLDRIDQLRQQVLTGVHQLAPLLDGLLHLTLALALTFFLFHDGHRLEQWFSSEIGDRGSGAHAFLTAIDRDLEQVYFGNVLTVLLVALLSLIVYNGFNVVAPPALSLPFPTLLALLTGLATFVPLVVGKLVYLPVALYLGWEAYLEDPELLWIPLVFLLLSFLLLDVIPQTVVRPYLSGRTLHTGLILFSYVFGVALFGWYGLFYGPLLVVFVVQFANVVFPELVRGEPVTPATASSVHIGTDPPDADGTVGEQAGGDADEADADEE